MRRKIIAINIIILFFCVKAQGSVYDPKIDFIHTALLTETDPLAVGVAGVHSESIQFSNSVDFNKFSLMYSKSDQWYRWNQNYETGFYSVRVYKGFKNKHKIGIIFDYFDGMEYQKTDWQGVSLGTFKQYL